MGDTDVVWNNAQSLEQKKRHSVSEGNHGICSIVQCDDQYSVFLEYPMQFMQAGREVR